MLRNKVAKTHLDACRRFMTVWLAVHSGAREMLDRSAPSTLEVRLSSFQYPIKAAVLFFALKTTLIETIRLET